MCLATFAENQVVPFQRGRIPTWKQIIHELLQEPGTFMLCFYIGHQGKKENGITSSQKKKGLYVELNNECFWQTAIYFLQT